MRSIRCHSMHALYPPHARHEWLLNQRSEGISYTPLQQMACTALQCMACTALQCMACTALQCMICLASESMSFSYVLTAPASDMIVFAKISSPFSIITPAPHQSIYLLHHHISMICNVLYYTVLPWTVLYITGMHYTMHCYHGH